MFCANRHTQNVNNWQLRELVDKQFQPFDVFFCFCWIDFVGVTQCNRWQCPIPMTIVPLERYNRWIRLKMIPLMQTYVTNATATQQYYGEPNQSAESLWPKHKQKLFSILK